jgi:hypothetical protein
VGVGGGGGGGDMSAEGESGDNMFDICDILTLGLDNDSCPRTCPRTKTLGLDNDSDDEHRERS